MVLLSQVLNDKQLRLILVLTDKALQARMDRSMQLYMKTNASLVWGEPWFWEKLRFYLAANPRGTDEETGREFQLLQAYRPRREEGDEQLEDEEELDGDDQLEDEEEQDGDDQLEDEEELEDEDQLLLDDVHQL